MPHPLDGPRLKIGRATSEIERLRSVQDAFVRNTRYRVIKTNLNPRTGKYIYRIRIEGSPPSPEWGIYIGEIAHNLRSSLDGLVWQLALQKTKKPAANTQFPIFLFGHTNLQRSRDKSVCFESYGRRMIKDLFLNHQLMIERLQPYKRGNSPHWRISKNGIHHTRSNPLWWLQEINNADKHRLLQTVAAKAGAGPIMFVRGDNPEINPPHFFGKNIILKNGTKIGEQPPEVRVDDEVLPLIAFDNGCFTVRGIGVIFVLNRITEHISRIIDLFADEF